MPTASAISLTLLFAVSSHPFDPAVVPNPRVPIVALTAKTITWILCVQFLPQAGVIVLGDPIADAAIKWVWINLNGDGGSVVLFHDRVVHVCAKAALRKGSAGHCAVISRSSVYRRAGA